MRPAHEAQAAFLLVAAVCGIALRSRVRRFESCWGRKIEHASELRFSAPCGLTWANVRHGPLSPAARAPGTPQDRERTMPPDVSALAGIKTVRWRGHSAVRTAVNSDSLAKR
jgi:hypothetical protein